MEEIEPTRILCRVKTSEWVAYRVGDISGDGFGAVIHIGDHLRFRYEQWATILSEKTSNYPELRNIVDTLEVLCEDGKIKD